MAKENGKKSQAKRGRTEQVRSAVDQAFQATAQATADAGQLTRERATEIADELVGNITRLREALDDARPATAEELKALRTEVVELRERLGRLEIARAADAITRDPGPAGARATPARASGRAGAKAAPAKASGRARAKAAPATGASSAPAAKRGPSAGAKRRSAASSGSPGAARRAPAAEKPAQGS